MSHPTVQVELNRELVCGPEAGQVVSDFGIGPWRRKATDFLETFEAAYSLREVRVGAASTRDPATGDFMGSGGVARLLKTHGGQWQVFAMGGDGSSECVRQGLAGNTFPRWHCQPFVPEIMRPLELSHLTSQRHLSYFSKREKTVTC